MSCTGDGSIGVKTGNWLFENFARTNRREIPVTYNPGSLAQLVAVVREVERESSSVKAIGTGWSYGDVAVDETLTRVINTDLLTGLVGSESVLPSALKNDLQPRAGYFVEVKAGTKVHVLNCLLDSLGLAMPTLGGSNGQSIAGAISTGSHGSDVDLGPIAHAVRAIHLVGPGGQEWWIERDGALSITDPDQMVLRRRFGPLCSDIRVEYDTPLFRSALVSLGRMGVIYSYVVETGDAFLLSESRFQSTWTAQARYIREKIQLPTSLHADKRFVEIILNPYPSPSGDHDCVVTNRELAGTGATKDPEAPPAKTVFDAFCEQESLTPPIMSLQLALPALTVAAEATALAGIAGLGAVPIVGPLLVAAASSAVITAATSGLVALQAAIASLLAVSPGGNFSEQLANVCNLAIAAGQKQLIPQLINQLIPVFRGSSGGTRESFRILTSQGPCSSPRAPESDCIRAIDGSEYALDVSAGSNMVFAFVNEVLALTDELYAANQPVGYVMSLRFCRKTDAILGMQQFDRTCSIEFIMLRGLGGLETFKTRVTAIARRLGAIPHWGLLHDLNATDVNRLYAEASVWRQSLQRVIEGGQGKAATFRSAFSIRRGLEPEAVQGPQVVVADPVTGETYPYDFGTCRLHERQTVLFHFPNEGQGTLRVLSVIVDGDFRDQDQPPSALWGTPGRAHNFEWQVVQGSALKGEEIKVRATFVAEEAGPHMGVLAIQTNAVNISGANIRLPIHALVEVASVEVLQPPPGTPLDLGAAGIGEWRLGTLRVRNTGTVDLRLDSVSLSKQAPSDDVNIETGAIGVGQTRTYTVTFVPSQVGTFKTEATLHFTDGEFPPRLFQNVRVSIRGEGVGAQAQVRPIRLDFGSVDVGLDSAPQAIRLTNIGQQDLHLTGHDLVSDFLLPDPLPAVVAPKKGVDIPVVFRPGSEGPVARTVTFQSDSARPPAPVVLHGTGVAAVVMTASPDHLAFDPTPAGSRSRERFATFRNHGLQPAAVQSIQITGPDAADFELMSSTCVGQSLTRETACEVRLVFRPGTAGSKQAQITLSWGPSSWALPIMGEALAAADLTPTVSVVDFGSVAIGTASPEIKVVIRNTGVAAITLASESLAGAQADEFQIVVDDCASRTLAPGEACGLSLIAQPQASGSRAAELQIQSTGPRLQIGLSVDGVSARMEWSMPELDFGPIAVGTRSPTQNVQLFNTGQLPLDVVSVDAPAEYWVVDMVPSINHINPHGGKYFRVAFTPAAAGVHTAALTVHCAAPGGSYTLPVRGIGVEPR